MKWILSVGLALATTVALAADNASLTGKVMFEGGAPKAKRLKMDADPKCMEMHADEPVASQEIVVNENGTLRNVFIYVKGGLDGRVYEPPKEAVVLNQHGCMYSPRVLGMQTRQPLKIRNSDDTLHNIHAMPTKNKEFNIGQPNKGMETTRTFAAAEVMVKFKCDVHPWMAGYIGVLEHPFFGVTGEDGAFALKNLPAGEYEVEAWHEKLGTQTVKVKIAEGEAKGLEFKFKAAD